MSIQAQRLIVGEGGTVTFRVPRPAGTPLHILIMDDAQDIDPTQNPELSQNAKQGLNLGPRRDHEQTQDVDMTQGIDLKKDIHLTDAERFQLGVLAAVTDDDPAEDAIWERYLRD
ncbi:MAG: hypothetical protein EOM92_16260 [Gammaproteobacteria bacterium]|jgi:hypothetical protein|nr:hypothetical protein [Gammaproteobacteria bacterium]